MVRRDFRPGVDALGVDALDQSGEKRVLVDDGRGDTINSAWLQPDQLGHYGDVANRDLQRKHRKQHNRGSKLASSNRHTDVSKAIFEMYCRNLIPNMMVGSELLYTTIDGVG